MSNGIVKAENKGATALAAYEPGDFETAWKLSKIIVESRLAPGLTNPSQVFVVLATGAELGLTAMQSIRNIHNIEGRAAPSADILVAVCLKRLDLCEFFREVETTDSHSTWEAKRRGDKKVHRSTFTMADAKTAGLVDRGKDPTQNNWNKHPKRMMKARAKAFLARDVFPDICAGLYTRDELIDGYIDELEGQIIDAESTEVTEVVEEPAETQAQTPEQEALPTVPADPPEPQDEPFGDAPEPEAEVVQAESWQTKMEKATDRKSLDAAAKEALDKGADKQLVINVYNAAKKSLS